MRRSEFRDSSGKRTTLSVAALAFANARHESIHFLLGSFPKDC